MIRNRNIKNIGRNLLWVALGIAVLVVLVAAMQKSNKAQCKNILVTIKGNPDELFLNEKDVLKLVNAESIINKKTISEIDIKQLEIQLEKNIWMADAELYFDKNSILHITVIERAPLCRIYNQNGNSFYIDKDLFVLPLSNSYSAKVPVFTGFSNNTTWNAKDSATLIAVQKMASFIYSNTFWMAQLQQIDINANNTFKLTPTLGNHTILFGDTTNMEAKFYKLFKFYKTVSTKVGFDKYSVLNVQFKNQIVATNKNTTDIDTASVTAAIQDFILNNADSTFMQIDSAAISNNNAKQKDSTITLKPTIPTKSTIKKSENINPIKKLNTPKPKATLPKPIVVKPNPKKPQQRSQQKKQ